MSFQMGRNNSYLYNKMAKKICSKCKEPKNVSQFIKNKRAKDGLDYWCNGCRVKSSKKWLQENPEKAAEFSAKNSEREKQRRADPEKREEVLEHSRKYYRNNKEKVIQRTTQYSLDRYRSDEEFKLLALLRNRIWYALKKYKDGSKCSKTTELVGCSLQELKLHLESKFQPGMSWENQGKSGWEVDHIIPCDKFDLLNEKEQRKCFHYTNLQPLWRLENQQKSNKI